MDSVQENASGATGKGQAPPSFTVEEMDAFAPIVNGACLDATIHGKASRTEVFEVQPDLNTGLNGVRHHQVCNLQLAAKASIDGLCVFLNFIIMSKTPPRFDDIIGVIGYENLPTQGSVSL
jgi:hypothetical protein